MGRFSSAEGDNEDTLVKGDMSVVIITFVSLPGLIRATPATIVGRIQLPVSLCMSCTFSKSSAP